MNLSVQRIYILFKGRCIVAFLGLECGVLNLGVIGMEFHRGMDVEPAL